MSECIAEFISIRLGWNSEIKGSEQIIMALAGVGKPIKESNCRESLLNFAKRIAEKIVIINAKYWGKN